MPDDALNPSGTPAWRRTSPLSIGDYEVRAASNEIVGPQGTRRLRPRLMHVLLRLAATPGDVVPRQTLLDDVWPRRAVADEVLSRTIAELRTALADGARESRYIETLPKVGYRLIAPVSRGVPGPTPSASAVAGADAPTRASDESDPTPASGMRPMSAAPSRAARTRTAALAFALIVAAAIAAALMSTRRSQDDATAFERQLASAVPFSSEPAQEFAPRFSADGARVVYAAGDADRSRLVVQTVATGSRRTLDGADAFRTSPVFFPDGERIAYYRRVGDDCAIVEQVLATGAERTLVGCSAGPFTRFDLASDGRHLVFGTREGLRLHDIERGTSTLLTRPPAGDVQDVQPRFSPDGSEVAFFRSASGGRSLWRVPVADPSAASAAGSPSGLSYGLAWLGPRGPIVAAVDWSGFRALHVFDFATRKATLAGARGAQFPDAAPDGSVVFENAAYQANLHWLDAAAPDAPRVLWPSTRYSNDPAIAPDGRRIAFTSNRDGIASLFVGTLDGDARRVPVPRDAIYGRVAWSPDGTALYAVREAVGGASGNPAVRIDVASGAVQALPALGDAVTMLFPSADGRALYAGRKDGNLSHVVRASIDDPAAAVTPLPLSPVASFRVRGARLAYTTRAEDGLVVCTLPDLACAALRDTAPLSGVDDWALGEDAVWFRSAEGNGPLRRYDLGAQRVTADFSFAPTALAPNVAVSPDGRHVVISRQDPPAIDLMLARRTLR